MANLTIEVIEKYSLHFYVDDQNAKNHLSNLEENTRRLENE